MEYRDGCLDTTIERPVEDLWSVQKHNGVTPLPTQDGQWAIWEFNGVLYKSAIKPYKSEVLELIKATGRDMKNLRVKDIQQIFKSLDLKQLSVDGQLRSIWKMKKVDLQNALEAVLDTAIEVKCTAIEVGTTVVSVIGTTKEVVTTTYSTVKDVTTVSWRLLRETAFMQAVEMDFVAYTNRLGVLLRQKQENIDVEKDLRQVREDLKELAIVCNQAAKGEVPIEAFKEHFKNLVQSGKRAADSTTKKYLTRALKIFKL